MRLADEYDAQWFAVRQGAVNNGKAGTKSMLRPREDRNDIAFGIFRSIQCWSPAECFKSRMGGESYQYSSNLAIDCRSMGFKSTLLTASPQLPSKATL